MNVFIDTSALFALLVADQDEHGEVAAEFSRLLEAGVRLQTTSYVLVETIALLQRRSGLIAVRELDERIAPILDIHWITPDFHRQGMARLFRENRRRLSLVDCVSMELIESQGLRDVFGLDVHFAEAGYRLLPRSSRI